MWKHCLFVSALSATAWGGHADYTITPSKQVAYYHYPAPPKSLQFQSPAQTTNRQYPQSYQYQQQQQQQQQQQLQQLSQQQYYQQQQQLQQQQQRYQQQKYQQQQRYLSPSIGKSQYPSSSNNYYRSSSVNKQFTSPALDNAAFNAALTNQGYTTYGNALTASTNAALTAAIPKPQSFSQSSSGFSSASSPAQLASFGTPASSPNSLNVKLPLPFNITPLNIAPLPLQAGTPYSALPKGVNSYGTTYPQRKRR